MSAPTEQRAARLRDEGETSLILHADVEEHVQDPSSGDTLRCDVTLRDDRAPLLAVEMKRPEVADVDSPALTADAHLKALGRGLPLYGTCNFREAALWRTADGPRPSQPIHRMTLAAGLRHSSGAPSRRQEIQQGWQTFIDVVAGELDAIEKSRQRLAHVLPPQVEDLRGAVQYVAEEAAFRIAQAVSVDTAFHDQVVAIFSEQFGVEVSLDPGRPDRLSAEAEQVATIACFVVATRLLLYEALNGSGGGPQRFILDPLEVSRNTSDPGRVAGQLEALYEHARNRTHDFEPQFTPSLLDHIAFVPSPSGARSDVGSRWADLIEVIARSDWTGPAGYVPGLYESLLDEEHRHTMGVHYTPEAVAEVIAAYAVQDAADVVMDPAAGAGTFATMCYSRKKALGSSHEEALAEIYAVEIADFAASLTGLNLALADTAATASYPRVLVADFFDLRPGGRTSLSLPGVGDLTMPRSLDAVVANPPYIRFETRSQEERRQLYELLARRYGEEPVVFPDFTGKADLWAFFVAQAHEYLKSGGRLAFVLSWSLLCSTYGDAVLSFLARYFFVDAIIDSRIERFFAAKQNTLLLLCRRASDPSKPRSADPNPNIEYSSPVRFVRLKQPLADLIDVELPRGKRAEDLIDEIMGITSDVGDDLRWDVHVMPQGELWQRVENEDAEVDQEQTTDREGIR